MNDSSHKTLPPEDDFRPSAARLVDSLRDTGYSRESAFADIIDNSIAAGATDIRIEITYLMGDLRVIFTDNGEGMSEDQLLAGMRYGAPKRDNPKSLGKFGMGLKTASTAFAQRLVVITLKDEKISSRAWDLDTIRRSDRWELETPDAVRYEPDSSELLEFTESNSGTMVIWEKVDRLIHLGDDKKVEKQLDGLKTELVEELSATFSRFLDNEDTSCSNVRINLVTGDEASGVAITPWDPLCRGSDSYEEGKKVQRLPEKIILAEQDGQKSEFKLTGSILPSQNDLTKEEQDKVRYTLDNQGLYIYREGRLIWHDGWPQRMYKKESKITRLRVVLDFNHELDDLFKIDFRKSRIIIPKSVRDELKKIIAPWRNHTLKSPSNKKNDDKVNDDSAGTRHSQANNAIGKHKGNTQLATVSVDNDTAVIRNRYNVDPVEVKGVHIYRESNIRIREEESLQGNVLWGPALDHECETCVQLGKSHPYFERMYATCKDNPDALLALDMLIWSLANAEFGTYSEKNKIILQQFRQDVSNNLNHLCLELPDPKEDF